MNNEITPEFIQAMVELGLLDEQGQAINSQLQNVERMNDQPQENPWGGHWVGALLGGAGNALRTWKGSQMAKELRGKQEANIAARGPKRDMYIKMLISQLMGNGGGPAAGAALVPSKQAMGMPDMPLPGEQIAAPAGGMPPTLEEYVKGLRKRQVVMPGAFP